MRDVETAKGRQYLVGLHNNEDVVDSNSQDQERNDLDHNEGEGDTSIAEDPQWGSHRAEDNQDTCYTQRNFRVHLYETTGKQLDMFISFLRSSSKKPSSVL